MATPLHGLLGGFGICQACNLMGAIFKPLNLERRLDLACLRYFESIPYRSRLVQLEPFHFCTEAFERKTNLNYAISAADVPLQPMAAKTGKTN